jgi:hypothetical protein
VNDYILKYIELAKFVTVQVSKPMEDECFQHYKLNAMMKKNKQGKRGAHIKRRVNMVSNIRFQREKMTRNLSLVGLNNYFY